MKSIIVLYHKDCPDGFGAAWAAWKKFGDKAEYIPIQASQTKDQLGRAEIKGKEVYLLDVCTSPGKLNELVKNNLSVTVIDHHGTNRKAVRSASQWYFDLNHSASVLSWLYFFPKKSVPWLLRYIEDADLWQYKLPNSNENSIRLFLLDFNFAIFNKMAKSFESKTFRNRYAKEGKLLLEYENEIIKGILKNSYEVIFKGRLTWVANTSVSHSQVGHQLIDKKHPVGITWYDIGDKRKFSLRSVGSTDVSKLAKQFPGGGGHKHAAGFTLPANKSFPWKIIKTKKER